jgi:hypothetical protein
MVIAATGIIRLLMLQYRPNCDAGRLKRGRSDMSFFTTRERAELGKSAEITMERKIRDVVRSEFAPRRRRPDNDLPGHVGSVRQQRPADNHLGGDIGSMLQQAAENSLQEIDDLLVVLRRRREELLNESARVERAVIDYAKLSQSTMQSTRIITESLSHLNKIPAPPPKDECHIGDLSNEEHRDGGSAAVAQHNLGGQAGETAVPASSDVSDLPEEGSGLSISRDGDTDRTGLNSPRNKALDWPSLAGNDAVPAHVDSA